MTAKYLLALCSTIGSDTLTAYRAAAAATVDGSSDQPAQVVGGVVEPLSAAPVATSAAPTTVVVTTTVSACPATAKAKRNRAGREIQCRKGTGALRV